MPITDPISDMLTRIRNAVQVRHEAVEVPASRMKSSLLKLLSDEGFITSFKSVDEDSVNKKLEVQLRYYEDKTPVIQGLKRVSKPGLRVYVGKNEVPRYFGGIGVAFMSTSKGVMTGQQARRQGVGGELLFYVW
ncbi:MAG TPA: 30S ribosomal protein S8 [Dehalococcoidia bacterium]|nr:30S ribosomal protein S8 [Dehalococcoidia bacterium]MEE2841214.1 30S ribosomal protein S8 [Chloroflexota bacterium]MQG29616.1 30S ribosomal protein S8 [SAR202 cluster bacterium]HAG55954.1 30S ribosomal protein S8 [Dehalococcoidia bacterium]HIM60808.1 30S ribosomal protein S8 [Dehalococcoidia bacterium]